MVFQRRLDSECTGYLMPKMPRFPRSARRRRSAPKKLEDNKMRAFDLLAAVAGELLSQEEKSWTLCKATGRTCPINKVKQEHIDNGSPSKSDILDQGSCDESSFVARLISHGKFGPTSEEHMNAASVLAFGKSDVSEKNAFIGKSIIADKKCGLPSKCFSEGSPSSPLGSCQCLDGRTMKPMQVEQQSARHLMDFDAMQIHNREDPMDFDGKCPAPVSSDSSVEISPCEDCYSGRTSSFHSARGDKELHVDRDDDENSSECTHGSSIYTKGFKPYCTVEHRLRRKMTSNCWKANRAAVNDGELSNDDVNMKPVFHSHKLCYTRQRTQRSSFKRKTVKERCSFSTSKGGFSAALTDSTLKDGIKLDTADHHSVLNEHYGSFSNIVHRPSYDSEDQSVKLSIKSFRVPELCIDLPANATVSSLKKTVVEAVTSMLSGGLRVGVLLKGKRIREDNKTLFQAGICSTEKLDNLGFTLEPSTTTALSLSNSHPCVSQSLNKIQARLADQDTFDAKTHPPLCPTTNGLGSGHGSINTLVDPSSVEKEDENSRALVPIPTANVEALAIVPLRNSRRPEMVQRRIRRPFSVSEVEALVQAVEKLGTGRWRDVKIRAFDNAKHRTYVDLKDKWKTLVHTARISPQQRRGEPVPQELLDRVLSAHAHWSQQQAKLKVKPSGLVEQSLAA
ncbi:hypothetical protein HPP92_026699 [Vanilla planifolia]|uniref:Uncharacterized protein n=1 Tax=Vanilla planifolia TaxID=51239 RepID=A0A835U8V1_VANPL|nr:hypothetical protein HPP92_026922 [Vanilla planifolia]KAG0450540.1 hypothetical protein HPP92_026699 [Vanilla planifolia]